MKARLNSFAFGTGLCLIRTGYPLINGIFGQVDKYSYFIGRIPVHFQNRDLQGELVHCQQGFQQFRIVNIIQQIFHRINLS